MSTFSRKSLTSSVYISVIDLKNCKLEGKIELYTFTPSIYNKNLLIGNQSVFQNLNIIKVDIDKTNT